MKPSGVRVSIVLGYIAVFWIGLPWSLWQAGAWLDARLPFGLDPWPAGWVVAGCGAAVMVASIVSLRSRGGGLPVSALPPPRLVVSGPYRWVRHPVYLGFHVGIVGVGFAVGSAGLAMAVGVAFLPAWATYAWFEERGLARRFGAAYRSYQRQVWMLPRLDVDRLVQVLGRFLLPVRVEGRALVPRRGAAVLVVNHACYADPVFLQHVTWRRIHFLATAEAFRGGAMAWAMRRTCAIPVRRYRVDPGAYRELLRRVDQGALVAVFVEGERAPLGAYQGVLPHVARVLRQLRVPIIPVGISGNYDAGPRWAGRLRVRPVIVRVGAPIVVARGHPAPRVDRAIVSLMVEDPQTVRLAGLERARLGRVLWRCPACLAESGWRAADLHCDACGARWCATVEGRFRACGGHAADSTLAELAQPVWEAAEAASLAVAARGAFERSMAGPIRPLVPLGEGRLVVTPQVVSFQDLSIPLASLRSSSTERADTLQLATSRGMWQFRVREGSVFRLQRAIDRWRRGGHARRGGRERHGAGRQLSTMSPVENGA